MRVKDGYILRKVAGNYIVVAVGEEAVDFNGLITTNETGAFLWEKLSVDTTMQELISAMLNEFDVDEAQATDDISSFVDKLKNSGLLYE